MKKCILLFFLLLLLACQDKKYFRDFIDVSDAIIYGCEVSKPSLLYLIDDNDKILSIKNCDTLVANFVCYMLHDPMKTDVGKIVHPSEYPIYVILERDSIVSILSSEEMKKELGKEDRRALKDRLLRSKYDGNNDIAYLNVLLKLYAYLSNQNSNSVIELSYLDSLINKHNKFYGKYLLAQLYKDLDVKNADEMYSDLWVNSTKNDMEEYPEEFIDIMKCKDHLVLVNKEDILFGCTEYDFGIISPNKEVTCTFSFTNNSSNRFIIHNVITTCGCTVPVWNRKPIAPNARDSISVKFKSNYTGVSQKTIIIEGNCKQKIELKIRASICN